MNDYTGVAYNNAIIGAAMNIAEEEGFEFVAHTRMPCGDGGISLGQAMMGAMELEKGVGNCLP